MLVLYLQDFQNFALYSRENKFSPFIQLKNMNVPSELQPPQIPSGFQCWILWSLPESFSSNSREENLEIRTLKSTLLTSFRIVLVIKSLNVDYLDIDISERKDWVSKDSKGNL